MWLATRYGFYSVVRKSPTEFHVRGRIRRDLENLLELTGRRHPIHEWPTADYRYRVIVDHRTFSELMAALALALDYPNFKEAIAATPDQREKLPAFHQVWAMLARFQELSGSGSPPPGEG